MQNRFEYDDPYNNRLENPLEFFAEPFEIKPENKLTVYRYNHDQNTPFVHVNQSRWNYEAKAVRSNSHLGVYGFTNEQVRLGRCDYFFNPFSDGLNCRFSFQFLQLEVDKNNIFHTDDMEVVFTEANFIKVLTLPELKAIFPQYEAMIDAYSIATSNNFQDQFMDNAHREYEAARRMAGIVPSMHNENQEIHGITHGIRVERNGNAICQMLGIDGRIIRPFAYLHDFCRENDGHDPEHGLRAAKHIEKHYDFVKYHFGLSDTEMKLLMFACENHTDMIRSDFEIVNACFDADRLDLPRVGTTPDPNYMATTIGGLYAMALQRQGG